MVNCGAGDRTNTDRLEMERLVFQKPVTTMIGFDQFMSFHKRGLSTRTFQLADFTPSLCGTMAPFGRGVTTCFVNWASFPSHLVEPLARAQLRCWSIIGTAGPPPPLPKFPRVDGTVSH